MTVRVTQHSSHAKESAAHQEVCWRSLFEFGALPAITIVDIAFMSQPVMTTTSPASCGVARLERIETELGWDQLQLLGFFQRDLGPAPVSREALPRLSGAQKR